MGKCPFCGMKDPKRSTKQLRFDHSNEALARIPKPAGPAKHFHTWNCPLDPETHLCPIGYDGKRIK